VYASLSICVLLCVCVYVFMCLYMYMGFVGVRVGVNVCFYVIVNV